MRVDRAFLACPPFHPSSMRSAIYRIDKRKGLINTIQCMWYMQTAFLIHSSAAFDKMMSLPLGPSCCYRCRTHEPPDNDSIWLDNVEARKLILGNKYK